MSAAAKYLVCILGPTAVGKTALAIQVAQHFGTEIISADSRQFYREISIGTAKPDEEELQQATHHLVGNISIHDTYTAGDFERDALKVLDDIFLRHDVAVLAGGSGLYVKALLEGLDSRPPANEALRVKLDQLFAEGGVPALQQRLTQADPDALSRMADPLNTQRLMRAIEIAEADEATVLAPKMPRRFIPIIIVLNLDRPVLYERINRRVDQMLDKGLEAEARRMLPYKHEYALQTVGYTELFDYFEGRSSLAQAVELIKQHTRNYAKRQLTWFRRQTGAQWFSPDEANEIIRSVESRMQR